MLLRTSSWYSDADEEDSVVRLGQVAASRAAAATVHATQAPWRRPDDPYEPEHTPSTFFGFRMFRAKRLDDPCAFWNRRRRWLTWSARTSSHKERRTLGRSAARPDRSTRTVHRVLMGFIVLYCGFAMYQVTQARRSEEWDEAHAAVVMWVEAGFSLIFVSGLALNLGTYGLRYLLNWFNLLDSAVVLLSTALALLELTQVYSVADSGTLATRTVRLLLIFRVVTAVLAQSQVAYENREDISSALTLKFEVADVWRWTRPPSPVRPTRCGANTTRSEPSYYRREVEPWVQKRAHTSDRMRSASVGFCAARLRNVHVPSGGGGGNEGGDMSQLELEWDELRGPTGTILPAGRCVLYKFPWVQFDLKVFPRHHAWRRKRPWRRLEADDPELGLLKALIKALVLENPEGKDYDENDPYPVEVPTTRPIPFLDARDESGASVILALFIANSDEAVDLALDMVRERPALLCDSHRHLMPDRTLPAWDDKAKKKGRVACEYEGENPLHVVAVNRRSAEACEMIRLAAQLTPPERHELFYGEVQGAFFAHDPQRLYGTTPLSFMAVFELKAPIALMLYHEHKSHAMRNEFAAKVIQLHSPAGRRRQHHRWRMAVFVEHIKMNKLWRWPPKPKRGLSPSTR